MALGLLALLPSAVFPIETLANLRPQLAALCLLLALAAASVGRLGMGVALGLVSAFLLAGAAPLFARPSKGPDRAAMTVVWPTSSRIRW